MQTYELQNFQTDVIDASSSAPVLVDFWAQWCGPCRTLSPLLQELAASAEGAWRLVMVDTEAHPELAREFGIRSIPSVKLFVHGKVHAEFQGALPKPALEAWLAKNLPDALAGPLEQVKSMIRDGQHTEAKRLLDELYFSNPSHRGIRSILAELCVHQEPKRALDLVSDIDESMPEHWVAESVRTIARFLEELEHSETLEESPVKVRYISALQKIRDAQYGPALEDLISIIREDRWYHGDAARKGCIAIFKLLGEEHETTMQYRRDFSSALY